MIETNHAPVELVINGEPVIIKKLPLGKYAELLKGIKQLPENVNLIDGKSTDEIIKAIPTILATCNDDAINMLMVVSGCPKEKVSEWGIDDAILVLETAFEVNNYAAIWEKIKKAIGPLLRRYLGPAVTQYLPNPNENIPPSTT